MRNRTTKPIKTKKQNRARAKSDNLPSVSLKDLNDVNGGACSHAGGGAQTVNQQPQPRRWIDLVRSGLS